MRLFHFILLISISIMLLSCSPNLVLEIINKTNGQIKIDYIFSDDWLNGRTDWLEKNNTQILNANENIEIGLSVHYISRYIDDNGITIDGNKA
ncbi:MAG: hypothetical protein LBQ93_02105, partial [Treponema sp.]|nr:hypothetical protein [Treponema sp.]